MENKKESGKNRFVQISFIVLAIIFTLCISAQVFLAGLAVFVDPLNWIKHIGFVHIFEYIPVLMFVLTFFAPLPRWTRWQSALQFGLVFLMYFTANSTSFLPWAAAAHPVIAMIMFWCSIQLTKRSIHQL